MIGRIEVFDRASRNVEVYEVSNLYFNLTETGQSVGVCVLSVPWPNRPGVSITQYPTPLECVTWYPGTHLCENTTVAARR